MFKAAKRKSIGGVLTVLFLFLVAGSASASISRTGDGSLAKSVCGPENCISENFFFRPNLRLENRLQVVELQREFSQIGLRFELGSPIDPDGRVGREVFTNGDVYAGGAFYGAYEAGVGAVEGAWNAVRHPIQTVQGMGGALGDLSFNTGEKISNGWDNYARSWNDPLQASQNIGGLTFTAETFVVVPGAGRALARAEEAIGTAMDRAISNSLDIQIRPVRGNFAASQVAAKSVGEAERLVIGRGADLSKPGTLGPGEFKLSWPPTGTVKSEWKVNSGLLRQEMRNMRPIRDASIGNDRGMYLNAERYLLKDRGWTLDESMSLWMPPTP